MSVQKWPLIVSLTMLLALGPSAMVRSTDELKKGDEPKKAITFEPFDITGTLFATDPVDRVRNAPCKIHRVKLTKGRAYQIDMASREFDTFLRLEDERGNQLAMDDDSGGNLNSRIQFLATADGDYQLIATTFNGAVGQYQLKVQERK